MMPVERFRSIEEMAPPWRACDDPGNLARVAEMLAFYRHLAPRPTPGLRKLRSVAEADAERTDPYRGERPDLLGTSAET